MLSKYSLDTRKRAREPSGSENKIILKIKAVTIFLSQRASLSLLPRRTSTNKPSQQLFTEVALCVRRKNSSHSKSSFGWWPSKGARHSALPDLPIRQKR